MASTETTGPDAGTMAPGGARKQPADGQDLAGLEAASTPWRRPPGPPARRCARS